MKVAITAQDTDGDFNFDSSGPWNEFKTALLEDGHKVVRLSEEPDAIICNNYSPRLLSRLKSIPYDRRAIIFWESPTSAPQVFHSKVLNLFKLKFFPSPIWASKFNGEYFLWPQNTGYCLNADSWDSRASKFCVIASEQFSFVDSELYSLRRRVVRDCTSIIDLYGYGWDRSRFFKYYRVFQEIVKGLQSRKFKLQQLDLRLNTPTNYVNSVSDKAEILQKYKFSLVIENNLEYVTEKIFDALINGCVTVYVGPSLGAFGIPEEVCFASGKNVKDLIGVLEDLPHDAKKVSSIRDSMNGFLGSEEFNQHQNSLVLRKLGMRVSEQLKSRTK